jgi:hypothetical protein
VRVLVLKFVMNERKGNFNCINFKRITREAVGLASIEASSTRTVKCPFCPVEVTAQSNHRCEVFKVSANQICTTPYESPTEGE